MAEPRSGPRSSPRLSPRRLWPDLRQGGAGSPRARAVVAPESAEGGDAAQSGVASQAGWNGATPARSTGSGADSKGSRRSRKGKRKGSLAIMMGNVGKAFDDVKSSLAHGFDVVDRKLEEMEDGADGPVKKILDRAMRNSMHKVMKHVGSATNEMMKPAYMPEPLKRAMDHVHGYVWPGVEELMTQQAIAFTTALTRAKWEHCAA